jgi:ferrous iron transport protein A
MLQLSGKKPARRSVPHPASVGDLRPGEEGILDRLDLPDDVATRLMELGFLPGTAIVRAQCAPGGDPRVFRVDGSEVALRKETATHLILRPNGPHSKLPDLA